MIWTNIIGKVLPNKQLPNINFINYKPNKNSDVLNIAVFVYYSLLRRLVGSRKGKSKLKTSLRSIADDDFAPKGANCIFYNRES